MNMKSLYNLVLFAFLLASCSIAPAATPIVQPSTALPMPEPTGTPIQVLLADLDLGPVLIQPGDLPAGYSGAQIRDSLPGMLDVSAEPLPQPINQVYQEFERNGSASGGVAVMIYDTLAKALVSYDLIVKWPMGGRGQTSEMDNLGEQARSSGTDWLLQRCSTLVYIRMTGTAGYEGRLAYAQKLDERLTELVCR